MEPGGREQSKGSLNNWRRGVALSRDARGLKEEEEGSNYLCGHLCDDVN
jgi:hypothetical protein